MKKDINDLSLEEQIKTVIYDNSRAGDIINPSRELQLALVRHNGLILRYLKCHCAPDREVQEAAVMQNGFSIGAIDDPDKKLQMLAVEQDPHAVSVIRHPHKDVLAAAVKKILQL